MYGLKHNLILTRNDNNDAIYRGANNAAGNPLVAGKVHLEKISWFMPFVTPADKDKMELYKIIERKERIPVGYRMIQCDSALITRNSTDFSWRLSVKSSPEVPRFIIVGFQAGKMLTISTSRSILRDTQRQTIISFFQHKNLVECMVMLLNLELSFLTWMSWYQTQTLPPQIIETYILYFCSTFPNKAKN